MRVSVRKDDPGYVKNPFDYSVFLNGIKIDNCFTADEEGRIVFIYKKAYGTDRAFLLGLYSKEFGCHLIMEGFTRGHVVIKKDNQCPSKSES